MNTNEHEERNKKSFWGNNWQWFVSMAIFIVFAAILIYNTRPQKQPDLQDLLDGLKKQTTTAKSPHIVKHETTTSRNVPLCDIWGRVVRQSVTTTEASSTTKTSNFPESYVYSKEDMDKILTTVALTARKDALNEYKQNFSMLLAILAVLGVAFPVIVAFLQHKYNDKEIAQIKGANKKSNLAISENTKLRNEMYYMIADNYYLNAIFWGNEMTRAKTEGNSDAELNGKRCHTRALIKMIYFYALAGKMGQANSKVGITIARLKEMQNLSPEQQTFYIDEVDWELFLSLKIKDAQKIKELADNVFCKLRPIAD